VVVLHGTLRNATEYLGTWREWAQRTGRAVLAPHFDRRTWPGARSYNLGNVLDAAGEPNPRPAWAFTALRHLIDQARQRADLAEPTWDLFGHSAGAQFAHRYALLGADPTLGRVVAAGAGWFTVPDPRIAWPYGTGHRRLGIDDAALRRFTRHPLLLVRGDHDRERDEHLRVGPSADAQGRTRWDRAAHMLAAGRAHDPFCTWELLDIPQAGHHEHQIAPIVQDRWTRAGHRNPDPPPGRHRAADERTLMDSSSDPHQVEGELFSLKRHGFGAVSL